VVGSFLLCPYDLNAPHTRRENGETDRDKGRDKGRKNGEKGGLGEVEIKRITESVATKRVKGKQRERERVQKERDSESEAASRHAQ
jgi:hypothetical protein